MQYNVIFHQMWFKGGKKREKELATLHTTVPQICYWGLREGFPKKKVAVLLGFVQITSPSPQFGQLVPIFLNAKNVDLSNIQNDSLSKILPK